MNDRIVITGASSAIGLAIAQRIVNPGNPALLHCFRHAEALGPWSEKMGPACRIVSADFRKRADLERFCGLIRDTDILINAAAYTRADLLPNLDEDDISAMIQVNIQAPIAVCRGVIAGMLVRRQGVIVNLSSVAAQRGNRGQTVYAGTKGFIEAFSRSLAAEYGGRGIRVNCVAPGAIDAGSLRDLLNNAPEEVKKNVSQEKLGTPADVAAAVAFLASPAARYINGKTIPVDGGFMRGI